MATGVFAAIITAAVLHSKHATASITAAAAARAAADIDADIDIDADAEHDEHADVDDVDANGLSPGDHAYVRRAAASLCARYFGVK